MKKLAKLDLVKIKIQVNCKANLIVESYKFIFLRCNK